MEYAMTFKGWTSKSVRGDYHQSGKDGSFNTSKFSSPGVKNPLAEGFISMRDAFGGKNSYTFYKDGTMKRTQTKGGFRKPK